MDDWRRTLNQFKRGLVEPCLASKDYQGALDALGMPTTPSERETASYCHYQLSKVEAMAGHFGQARMHASEVERAMPASRALRALNSERLRLLANATPPLSLPSAFNPGQVSVYGVGDVLVLGRYEAWGHHGDLTKSVLLLKRAPEEHDGPSAEARAQLAEGLGCHMFRLLRESPYAPEVDVLIPIPSSPERYVTRMFHVPTAIAKTISRLGAIPLATDVLLKVEETRSLRGLGPEDRDSLIKGSMAVSARKQFILNDVTVLLIDDVVTYGTHFREAKHVLMAAGAREVRAMALATAHGFPY